MKLSSLAEAIANYTKKTGEVVECDEQCSVKILPSNEFMIWKLGIRDGIPFFFVDQTYGHFKNFVDLISDVCKSAGVEIIVTATCRNPKPYIRKWKMDLVEEYDFENRHYYLLKTHISNMKG